MTTDASIRTSRRLTTKRPRDKWGAYHIPPQAIRSKTNQTFAPPVPLHVTGGLGTSEGFRPVGSRSYHKIAIYLPCLNSDTLITALSTSTCARTVAWEIGWSSTTLHALLTHQPQDNVVEASLAFLVPHCSALNEFVRQSHLTAFIQLIAIGRHGTSLPTICFEPRCL